MGKPKRVRFFATLDPATHDTIKRIAKERTVSEGCAVDFIAAALDWRDGRILGSALSERAGPAMRPVEKVAIETESATARPPRKLPKKAQRAAELAASDPTGAGRSEIDYGSPDQIPAGGSVAVVGAARPVISAGGPRPHNMHSGIRPIAGCPACAKMVREAKRQNSSS